MTEAIVHHIMWQPLFDCGVKCKGCYVARSHMIQESRDRKIPSREILDLLESGEVSTSQFTVSLDNSFDPNEKLVKMLKDFWPKAGNLTSLCITARNFNSIQIWARAMGIQYHDFLEPIKTLTLSTMPILGKQCDALRELCEEETTRLHYNKLIDTALLEPDLGMRYAHQTYLILKKEPLSDAQSSEAMRNLGTSWKNTKDATDCSAVLDKCLEGAQRKAMGGFSCGAGKDIMHIWPDTSVTGCPYDSNNKAGARAISKEPLLDRIQEVQSLGTDHCTQHCKIMEGIISHYNQKPVENLVCEG